MGTWRLESRFPDSANEFTAGGIIEARDILTQADAHRTISTCLGRYRRGNGAEYFPIVASVQIAINTQRV